MKQRVRDAIALAALFLTCLAPAHADEVFVDPAIAAPDENGVVRFSVAVDDVPEPGFRSYALSVRFDGASVNLVETINSFTAPPPADRVSCSAVLRTGAVSETVVPEVGVILESGQGAFVLDSQGSGTVLATDNRIVDANTAQYNVGVAGETGVVTPQSGGGSLIDFRCYVGADVPSGTNIIVTPGLYPGLDGAILLDETGGSPIINAFTRGTIQIGQAANQPPELSAIGSQSVDEGGTLNIGLNASDLDNDTLTFTQTGLPAFCSLTDNGGGSAVIDCAPQFGDAGSYSITVTVTDDGDPNLSDSETFTLTIGDVNRAPELGAIGNQSVDEGATLNIGFSASDLDNDSLAFTQTGLPGFCTLSDNGGGNGAIDCAPQFGDAGSYSITVTVTDDGVPNLSDSETFTLAVGDVNREPELGAIGDQSVDEGDTLNVALSAVDPDGDNLSITADGLPAFCALTDNGGGSGVIDCAPQFDDAGSYPITVTVTDDGAPAESAAETLTLTVNGVNRAPVLELIGNREVQENELLEIVLSATDPDGDTLSFEVGDAPTGAVLTDNGDGTALFSWTPSFAQAGNHTPIFIVTDDGEPTARAEERITITVGDVNRPPELDAIGNQDIDEGGTLNIGLGASDLDGDNLSFDVGGLPGFCTLTDNGGGSGNIDCAPQFGDAGNYAITVTVTDDGDPTQNDSETFTLTVGDVNRPPELDAIGDRTVDEGALLEITLTASDPDGDGLTLTASGLPTFCALTDNTDGAGAIDCAPQFGDAGNYEITVTVTDDGEPTQSASETFTLTVGDVNRLPELAAIGDQSVDEDGTLNVALSADDPDGDALSFTADGLPAFCTLTDNGNGTGTIDCTSQFGDAGNYEITVTVTDDGEPTQSASETFTLTVGAVNRPPELAAIADQSVDEGDTLNVALSASDPDGDNLSITADGLPAFCTLTDNGNGSGGIDCAPQFGDAGSYPITVTVTDDGVPAESAEQSFTLTVGAVNRPPQLTAIGDQSVDEGDTLNVALSAVDPDGDNLSITADGLPAFCTLTDNGDGSGAIDCTPAFGDAGNYPVTVTVTDDGVPAESAEQSFTLTVGAVNRPPQLTAIGDQSVNEGDILNIPLSASDPDGDSLSFTVNALPGFCTLSDNGDGTGTVACAPGFTDAGSYTPIIIVTDDGAPAESAEETITITVIDVNRPPQLDPIDDQTVAEGDTLTVSLTAADPDADALSFTADGVPAFCTLIDNGDGNGAIDCTPDFGDADSYPITVTVSDDASASLSDSEAFTLSVGAVNRPPQLAPIGDQSVAEGNTLNVALSANDPDGDNLSFTADGLPAFCTLTDDGDGTGAIDCTPGFDDAGTYPVTVTVTDDGAGALNDSESFTITVSPSNQAPELEPIGNREVQENELLEILLTATDPDGDTLSFEVGDAPTGAVLTDNGDGTALFSWTPTFAQAGNYTPLFIVTDDGVPMARAEERITITVGEVNRPPELDLIEDQEVAEGALLEIALTANDADGDGLAFSEQGLPAFCALTDNTDGTGVIDCAPQFGDAGNYAITVTVTDDGAPAESAEQTFTLTVGDVNRPPELDTIGDRTVDVGALLEIALTASDPDGDGLTLSETGLPDFCTLTDNGDGTGLIDCAPQFGDAGNYAITVTVTDDGAPAESAEQSFTLTVGAVNRPPELAAIGDQSVDEDGALNVALSAGDPDGDALSFTADGLPAFCIFTDNTDGTGVIDCTPQFGDAGSYPITVTVTDDGDPNLSESETFTLTVGDVNRLPELGAIADQSVDEGDILNVALSASDPDGDNLSITADGLPTFCTLTDNGNGTGTIDCTPQFGDAGSYPITVTVTDDGDPNLSDSEIFTLTVNGVNGVPELSAIADQSVDEDGTLNVALSAGDPDGDALSFTADGLPAFCTLIDNADGTGVIDCAPQFGDAGSYPITVTVTDDGDPNLSASETFTLTVGDVNRAPELAAIGDQSVDEDGTLNVALSAVDPDGDALSFTADGLPAFCTLIDNADGTGVIDCAPQFGDAGSYPLSVTVTDDGDPNLSDSESFTLSVGGVNRPPELTAIGDQSVAEGDTLNVALSANDPDGDNLSFAADGLPAFCTLTDDGDGTGAIDCTPGFDDAGTYPVTVTVTDDGAGALNDSESFTITVSPSNQAPELEPIGNREVQENELLEILLTATDPDGDALSFEVGDAPTGAVLIDNGDGTALFSWTPSFAQAGNHTPIFIVTDDGVPMARAEERITITVGEVNRPPELDAIEDQEVAEGALLEIALTANDADGDGLAFSEQDLPAFCTLTDNTDGTGVIDCAPQFGDAGNYAITVTVTDDGVPQESAAQTFTLTVGDVNRSPELDAIGDRTVDEGALLEIALTASDPDGDEVTFTATGLPAFCALVDYGDRTGVIDCAPLDGDAGDFEITVTVTDNGSPEESDGETFTIRVLGPYGPPVLSPIGDRQVVEGELLEIVLTAYDPDDDSLAYAVSDVPAGATFIDYGDGTATLSWTPEPGQAGEYPVTFTVVDDGIEPQSDEEEIVITVTPASNQETTLCSTLGDDSKRWRPDVDRFLFYGAKHEKVEVTLEKDATGTYSGKRATLVLNDLIRGVRLYRIDRSSLPNRIEVKLPATGRYRIQVLEQSRFARGKKFTGDYCLTVESSENAHQTLQTTGSVE